MYLLDQAALCPKGFDDLQRPGMEGIGKVEVDERKLIAIFMGPLIRWAKLKYWAIWP